jgi:hypothetical protein
MVPNDPADSLDLPIVVRNNTMATVTGIKVTALARDGSGGNVGTGNVQLGLNPIQVKPGQVAIGDVFFDSKPPAAATVTFRVSTEPISGSESLLVSQSNAIRAGGGFIDLVGTVKNQTKGKITSSPSVTGICFSLTGVPLAVASTSTDDETLPAGAVSPFSSQVFGNTPACPIWLVSATAFTS